MLLVGGPSGTVSTIGENVQILSSGAYNALTVSSGVNLELFGGAISSGALTWTALEWVERKKPTLLGMLSGMVAGLVAITPAAGYVDPKGAMIIGLLSGPVCYAGAVWLKKLRRTISTV